MLEKNEQRRRLLDSKRSLICRGAMKVLKKKKFHAASMGEIAEATGMSRGNFYHYIEKKEDILVLIGPEGDFSPDEITLAKQHGFLEISLGISRLRTETAALTAVHTVALCNEIRNEI